MLAGDIYGGTMASPGRSVNAAEPTLRALLDTRVVQALAGSTAFDRGSGYHHDDDRVVVSLDSAVRIAAKVRGSRRYEVELWVGDDGELYWQCSCPAADDRSFCKHAVAVSLGVIDGSWAADSSPAGPPPRFDLGAYVESLPHERLVEIVMAAAESDLRLRSRLTNEMVLAPDDPIDVGDRKRQFGLAIGDTGADRFVDDRHAPSWADGVAELVTATRNLLVANDQSSGRAIVEIAEYAFDRLAEAAQFVDDHGEVAGLIDELTDLHFDACAVARFDPIELARRLVELESHGSELDAFHHSAGVYAPLLGPSGRAEMDRLARSAWESMSPPEDGTWSSGWARVHGRMLAVARASGDVDELIAVHGRDMSTARAHLDIIEALSGSGRTDEAIAWAERALTEPGRWIPRGEIRERLAALLIQRGESARVAELLWDVFAADQTIETYKRWVQAAGPDHQAAADRAIDWLRPVAEAAAAAAAEAGGVMSALEFSPPPVHTLIDALLTEGRTDDAWNTARRLAYVGPLTMALAETREASHPLDAVDVYEPMVFTQIDIKSNEAYAAAVELLGRIRRLGEQAGTLDRFDTLLASVRTGHKPKRNLMKLLDEQRWD